LIKQGRGQTTTHAWVGIGVALVAGCILAGCGARSEASLGRPLSDHEFWELSTSLSEPAGTFTHSENLVSNEGRFAHTIRLLRRSGGAYIGVGPEQNFSYIARLEPAMAFIIDIRQENRNLHLMYKALFEVSSDRTDFVFRLFSRQRPVDVASASTVEALFQRLASAPASEHLKDDTLRLIRQRLVETRRFPLTSQDVDWIAHALDAFHTLGPDIHYYARSEPSRPASAPSYRFLMTSTDVYGEGRSYLSSDVGFAYVKDLQHRNLIVPIVGDFSGPSAIRRTGDYIRHRGGVVTTFYSSNVEVYLTRQQTVVFCGNLETLPRASTAWFINARGMRPLESRLIQCAPQSR
jgi:hypothetical protein